MNLAKLQINACIRSGWQAIDLGFLMARAWWRQLYLAGLLWLLPIAVVALLVFMSNPLWALFVIWWLKPFCERLPLFTASRLLFAEESGTWTKSLLISDALPWLLWRRFSFQRAFDHPVTVLENLSSASRRNRLRVLHGKYSDVAVATQLVCFCFEILLAFGFLMLVDFFIPDSFGVRYYDVFGDLTLTGEWIITLAGIAAITLVSPFHTMAGFALYLNRRIELEAWDIEISFRNIADRKKTTVQGTARVIVAMLCAVLITLSGIDTASAAIDHDQASAAKLIEAVLEDEAFGRERTVRKWRFKDWSEAEDDTFPDWIIDFIEWWEANIGWSNDLGNLATWVKFLLVILFVGVLLYLFKRYQGPLARLVSGRPQKVAPQVMFGMDVRPQSLPADIPAEVMRIWDEGGYREALSLLYRASLSRLIDRYELAFRASHTEAECAALVMACGIDSLSDYFWQLTTVWRLLAYGHQKPESEIVRSLCAGWSRELSDAS